MIASIPNALFYEGKLLNGVHECQREAILKYEPVMFINVEGKEIPAGEKSYRNYAEANFVMSLCKRILDEASDPDLTLGIITLYKSQEVLLETLLGTKSEYDCLRGYKISTVDAFQGAERDVIIMSCVRTDGIGFIKDKRRLNVALTRAKRHLIIVGSYRNLCINPVWGALLNKVKQVGKILSSDYFKS